MLNVALHNPRQHRQLQHSQGPLVLARMGSDHSVWMPVDRGKAQSAKARLEIVPGADGIVLAMTGCEAECFCGRVCGLTGSCQLPVPASFAIGDTRFEICDSDSPLAFPARPLERLLKDEANELARKHRLPDRLRRRSHAGLRQSARSIAGQPVCRNCTPKQHAARGSHRARRRHAAAPPRRPLGNRRQPPAAPGARYPMRPARP